MVNSRYIQSLDPSVNKDTRSGFGEGLLEVGKRNENAVALCADLTGSLKMNAFEKAFPDRFFQVGIAEANMMGVAAGMTIGGKIPFTGTFANFSTGRVYDQIRQSIAYSEKNVKICASHAGLTLGEDGATHQILEDIGMMNMLPNMTVICPADFEQTKQATQAIAEMHGPVYLRFGRPKVPVFMRADAPFEIGKIQTLMEGNDVTIVATGHLVWEAIKAAQASKSRCACRSSQCAYHQTSGCCGHCKVIEANRLRCNGRRTSAQWRSWRAGFTSCGYPLSGAC